jgi:hypothetical protein
LLSSISQNPYSGTVVESLVGLVPIFAAGFPCAHHTWQLFLFREGLFSSAGVSHLRDGWQEKEILTQWEEARNPKKYHQYNFT